MNARRIVALVLLGSAAAAAVIWQAGLFRDTAAGSGTGPDELRFYRVKRDNLRIGIVQNGQLRAVKHHRICSELDGRAKIAWVIEEGKEVKKGDKLLEFEKKQIEDTAEQREADLEQARFQLEIDGKKYDIQKVRGERSVSKAEAAVKKAEDALKKYKELDGPKQLDHKNDAVAKARKAVDDALAKLEAAKGKADEQLFVGEDERRKLDKELTGAHRDVEEARKKVAAALVELKVFKVYDYSQALRQKQEAIGDAQQALREAEVNAESTLQNHQTTIHKTKKRIKRIEDELEKFRENLEKCVIAAPADGMVLYGDPGRRGYYRGGREVEVGTDWSRGNTILTIPDCSEFEVDFSISEAYRGRLKPGCDAQVTIEAIPGVELTGKIKRISSLGRGRIPWDQSSPKIFPSVLSLDELDSRMVSGMTARVDVVAEIVEDVLIAPIEAVFNEDGEAVCFVRDGDRFERRVVKPGKSNDDLVEIVEGLAEGEEIHLYHPRQAEPEEEAETGS